MAGKNTSSFYSPAIEQILRRTETGDPVDLTRRDLGKLALAAIPASRLLAKPNSTFDGVRVGVITYSYRSMPGANDAEALLKYIVDSGISEIELMAPAAEIYSGSPAAAGRGGGGGGQGRGPGGGPG